MSVSASKLAVWNRALDRIGSTERLSDEDDDRVEADVCRRHYDDLLVEMLEARQWPWARREQVLANVDEQSTTTAYDVDDPTEVDFDVPYAFVNPSQLEVVLVASGGGETVLDVVDDYVIVDNDEEDDSSASYVTLATALTAGQSLRITVTTTRNGWLHVYPLPADCVTPVALLYPDVRHAHVPVGNRQPFAIVDNDAGDGKLLCSDLDADELVLEYIAVVDNVTMMPRKFVDALAWRLAAELASAIKKDTRLHDYCLDKFEQAMGDAMAQSQNIETDIEALTPSLVARG